MNDSAMGDDDRDLLVDLLGSEPHDARRLRLAAERPDLARELEALERTAGELDRRADESADVEIAEALKHGDQGLEDRLEAFAMGAAPSRDDGPVERRSPLRLLSGSIALAAAAALILILADVAGDGPEPNTEDPGVDARDDLMLNDGTPDGTAWPGGAVAHWDSFRWTGEPSAGRLQQVRIWAAERPFGRPLLESTELVSPTWTPDPTTLSQLPATIVWRVFEIDPITGEERQLHEQTASIAD